LEISQPILPYVIKAPNIAELELLQEAFITSASRGIVPVVEIDLFKLGDGTPGPLTRQLRAAYEEWIVAHLEEI
jgi:branched-subunit amino acid aminotransferase/4-amino-4-deoxychorismate lyase